MTGVAVGGAVIGPGHPLALIAGPCVIESESHALLMAAAIAAAARQAGLPYVFKSSYDKANRTSAAAFRGIGRDEGLRILEKVKRETGVPVLTDVHDPDDAAAAAQVVDVIQIPAFLCRQTDLLLAAGNTGKPVNIKKGQFLAPWDMRPVAEKVASTGNRQILLTERGATFGYNNLVVDFRSLKVMAGLGYPVIFDATHSVQLPGGLGHQTGGERQYVAPLARAAVAAGCDGVFLEVHDNPDAAPCDGPNMLELKHLPRLLAALAAVRDAVGANEADGPGTVDVTGQRR